MVELRKKTTDQRKNYDLVSPLIQILIEVLQLFQTLTH